VPDWLVSTLSALPALVLMFGGVGLGWAFVVLPRQHWRDLPMLGALTIALGASWVTVWMLFLGVLGQNNSLLTYDNLAGDPLNPMQSEVRHLAGGQALLRADLILIGTIGLTFIGWGLAYWRKRQPYQAPPPEKKPLFWDEKLLIGLIVIATLGRWVMTSWLGFGSWDELWVYGYQGRLYTLLGFIPSDIGYYPQFMPLQYAYLQILNGGVIDDHIARASVPLIQLGSILTASLLGRGLFNRRIGIITASIWALYPHFVYWSRIADLEIPLTFGFTGAAAFFLMAWTTPEKQLRRHYALLAGFFLGVTMWIKPTGGAFILGVVLLVIADFLRVVVHQRADWRGWLPRFEVAFLTGLACMPLGGVWYLRNILLGHQAVTFPPSVWLTMSQRSGQEFGWLLLALGLLLAYFYLTPHTQRPNKRQIALGVAVIALALAPTIINPQRMNILEWGLLIIGLVILGRELIPFALKHLTHTGKQDISYLLWGALLALPYFITWFYSYSYHYRLSFAIVPLLILPSAVILGRWLTIERLQTWKPPLYRGYLAGIVLLSVPAVGMVNYDEGYGWNWLKNAPSQDDPSRSALTSMVQYLQDYKTEHDNLLVVAPGVQMLQFFFPLDDIRITSLPLATDTIPEDITHFVHAVPDSVAWYDRYAIKQDYPSERLPYHTQWFTSLWRENVLEANAMFYDRVFVYDVFEVNVNKRFEEPETLIKLEDEVIFGDFARLVGYSYSRNEAGDIDLMTVFEVLAQPDDDYSLFFHVLTPEQGEIPIITIDGPVREYDGALTYFSTRFWEQGEYVIDRRTLATNDLSTKEIYDLRMGFYSIMDGRRAPVSINHSSTDDGYLWDALQIDTLIE
jgi:4-amino-4-deoxy-L-arabinose transferase-like glycosyltransferase